MNKFECEIKGIYSGTKLGVLKGEAVFCFSERRFSNIYLRTAGHRGINASRPLSIVIGLLFARH